MRIEWKRKRWNLRKRTWAIIELIDYEILTRLNKFYKARLEILHSFIYKIEIIVYKAMANSLFKQSGRILGRGSCVAHYYCSLASVSTAWGYQRWPKPAQLYDAAVRSCRPENSIKLVLLCSKHICIPQVLFGMHIVCYLDKPIWQELLQLLRASSIVALGLKELVLPGTWPSSLNLHQL